MTEGLVMNLTTPESVQKLQRALHGKAKESSDFRFYALYDRYTTNRLRRWFCKKHKQPGRGFTHYPDEYLYQKLGLIRLPMLPQNFPWAKA